MKDWDTQFRRRPIHFVISGLSSPVRDAHHSQLSTRLPLHSHNFDNDIGTLLDP